MSRTRRPSSGRWIARGPRPREWLLARVVEDENGCWVWTGDRSRRGGYGRVYLGFDDNGKRRFGSAAAAFYREFIGPIPEGGWLLHSCDNPPCVNPEHLFIGDHAANMRDMVAKGRSVKGVRRGKLSDEQIRGIRGSKETQRALSAQYGVDPASIWRIRNGQSYKGVV